MKYAFSLLFLFLTSTICISQNYYSIRQTQINQSQSNQINNINIGPSSYSIMYAVNSFVNIYNDYKRERIAKEKAQAKLSLIKQNYTSYDSYPDTISTGWHNVIATDNFRFCREAKVYVKNNSIQEFVIDNCIRLNFTSAGKIKNAKNIVTLNKLNGEQLEIADIYFIYDIDEPTIATPPLDPGYVSFWTSKNKYVKRKIIINKMTFEGVSRTFDKIPQCSETGTFTLLLKPGTYPFRVMKSGNDLEGTIEIKSGQCLMYKMP